MKLPFKNIDRNKKIAIIVVLLFFIFILTGKLSEFYRGAWIYDYEKSVSLFISLGVIIIASVVNTLFLITKYKSNLKKNIFWIFISAIPILYILMMIFLM
ncbi:hypothetical protein [Polaribacter sp. SA4-12]|uniref:hypothetical protein n=1 Tax=Polaribacter sp. SA4-12 TaxID=1312072 RepID=UPI000B3BF5FA|nr:hypothetical protein [Polaribacter sp. SA4-12]ARV15761.1 hypothetical protein BTO07_11705 [Polaribacter sp. SA4-12]